MTTVSAIKKKSDIKKIEKYFADNNKRDLLMFVFGINTGLRISDILKLNISDVKNKQDLCIKEQKTGKFKNFPLNSKLIRLIDEYTQNTEGCVPLFMTKYGNRLDRIEAYKILNKACKINDVNVNIGTHTLRKTFGYHFYKKYKDIVLLQKIFNHSTPNVTLRYIGIEEDEIFEKYLKFIL